MCMKEGGEVGEGGLGGEACSFGQQDKSLPCMLSLTKLALFPAVH